MIVVIILIATFLRTWNLQSLAIFFGDAAHDLIVAEQSVQQSQFPLLGIASSVPRFKQGPLTVWLEMAIWVVTGHQLLAYSLVFAVISVAAIIATYELMTVHVSRKAAIITSLIIAVSPLAMAHGRMPYHITPIPVMVTLFLYTLVRVWQRKPQALFWAVLAWAGAFQFELALAPLILVIPYIYGHQRRLPTAKEILAGGVALGLGLLPQIISDLKQGFSQLVGFGIWIGHEIAAAGGVVGEQGLGLGRIGTAGAALWLYGGRILTVDALSLKLAWVGLLGLGGWAIFRSWRKRQLPPVMELVVVSLTVLTLSFLIHGSPSEAYFPPFIVLLPMIIGFGLAQLRQPTQQVCIGLIVLLATINIWQIWQHHFFVSNSQTFSYGPSVGEQRLAVALVNQATNQQFQFMTTEASGVFPNYFDNFRWVAAEQSLTEDRARGVKVYIEKKDSPLGGYPGMMRIHLPTLDLYHLPL